MLSGQFAQTLAHHGGPAIGDPRRGQLLHHLNEVSEVAMKGSQAIVGELPALMPAGEDEARQGQASEDGELSSIPAIAGLWHLGR